MKSKSQDFHEIARIAEMYGDGTVRLTCEENIIFVNVPEVNLAAMKAEPLFQRFQLDAGTLTRGMVTCTGSQFCGFALTETKNKAISVSA
jgi:ferredoxin-nitrite reductase